MKIEFPRAGVVGDTAIDPGEYMISISPESSQMVLVGRGGQIKLKAVKRPSKMIVKRPKVTFGPSMGDPFWIITYSMPPRTEWVAFVKLERRQQESDD